MKGLVSVSRWRQRRNEPHGIVAKMIYRVLGRLHRFRRGLLSRKKQSIFDVAHSGAQQGGWVAGHSSDVQHKLRLNRLEYDHPRKQFAEILVPVSLDIHVDRSRIDFPGWEKVVIPSLLTRDLRGD